MYALAKNIHLIAVSLSILFFIVRFVLLQIKPAAGNHKLLRTLPHIIYTVLILSAGWMCTILHIYPFATPWLTFKLLGLIGFVLSGIWATVWAKHPLTKWAAFASALLFIAMTVYVAVSKQPLF